MGQTRDVAAILAEQLQRDRDNRRAAVHAELTAAKASSRKLLTEFNRTPSATNYIRLTSVLKEIQINTDWIREDDLRRRRSDLSRKGS
jgi:hypothetical protein